MDTVADIMSTTVFTLGLNDSLFDARTLMVANRIRHIPIVDDAQELIGLITQRDVLAAEESCLIDINETQRVEREKSIKIVDFYRQNIIAVDTHASIYQAALKIQQHKIGCLPVVHNRKLIGVVTATDFINVAINLMEVLAEQEPMDS